VFRALKMPGSGWLARSLGIALAGLWLLGATTELLAEPPLPPKPTRYFNDYAKVVPADAANRINAKLEAFERATSNQVVVAVFPKLPEGAYLEDYTVKTAESWGAGGKQQDNGIVLFVFVADRDLRIEVGYGLEGVVPDSIAKSIIVNVIQPKFRAGDYAGGLEQGVEAIFKATRNEYKGTGKTQAENGQNGGEESAVGVVFLLLFAVLFVWMRSRNNRGDRRGRSWHDGGGPGGWFPMGGGGFGGGGGGGSFGGGGGFDGGGGSFGGGGASGDW
jgi:uncharacterized protein